MANYHHFQKFVAIKHCFGTKWQSTTFYVLELTKLEFLTVLEFSKLEFLVLFHRGTADLEFVQLKKIMWYSSLVNSSTMQHNTRVYQARVPFYNKIFVFFSYNTRAWWARVPYKLFFFLDYRKININIKISSFFTFLFI